MQSYSIQKSTRVRRFLQHRNNQAYSDPDWINSLYYLRLSVLFLGLGLFRKPHPGISSSNNNCHAHLS
jgi:hypothetical protein